MNATLVELLPFVIVMLLAGGVSGIIAGLLGVGGGIVTVPVLELALTLLGVDASVTMKIAVATSMATIIPTSISSTRAHARRDSIDRELVKAWAAPLILGALCGALLATYLHSKWLSMVFAVVASLVAAKMLAPVDHWVVRQDVPRSWRAAWLPFSIAGISSLMGIGGGSLSVPTMTLCNQPIHRAVGAAAFMGLWISIPSTLGFLLARAPQGLMPPFSIGYVNFVALIILAPASWLAAPWGARLAHRLSRRRLSMAFGCFLLIVAIRMIYRVLTVH